MLIFGMILTSLLPFSPLNNDKAFEAVAAGDAAKPLVVIQQPSEGYVGSAGVIQVKGRASDNSGGSGVKVVEVRLDDHRFKLATPVRSNDWSTWSASFSVTQAGTHTIKARATDRSNNQDWDTVVFTTRSPRVDTEDPVVTISSPVNDATILLNSGAKLTIKGTSSDNNDVKAVDIRLVDNAYVPATPRASDDWSTWSAVFSVPPGEHRFIARATDFAGNQEWANLDITVKHSTDPNPAPLPSSEDKFGVVMLYPDSSKRPDSWFMDMSNPNINRKRFDVREDDAMTKNSDGSWKIRDEQVRMNVYNKNGYSASKISTYDRSILTQKGYMQDVDDWKNVELTMFVKLNSFSGSTYFSPYARSGWHTDGTAPNGQNFGCEGTGVKPRIYNDGQVAEVKEMWHNDGYAVRDRHDVTTNLQGRWLGIKTVIYDVPLANGKIGVKQELWINESGDPGLIGNWKKVIDGTDVGGWGTNGDGMSCKNSRPDQPIFWGGPVATFRWDNADNVDFKWLSVREIEPLK
jgi:hypothetical protein